MLIIIIFFCAPYVLIYASYGIMLAADKIDTIVTYEKNKDELVKMIHKETGSDVVLNDVKNDGDTKIYKYCIENKKNENLIRDIMQVCNRYLSENANGSDSDPKGIIVRFVDYDREYTQIREYPDFMVISMSNIYDVSDNVYRIDNKMQYLSVDTLFRRYEDDDKSYNIGAEYDEVYRSGKVFEHLPDIHFLKMEKDAWEGFSNQGINWYEVFPELESFIVTETDYDNGETIYYRVEGDGTLKKLLNDDSLLSYCSYDVQDMFESGELPVAVRHETDGESGKVCYETTERQMITDIMDAFRRIHVLNQMESSSYQEPNNLILVMADGRTYTIRFNQFYFAGNQEDELQKYNLEECNDFWDLIWDVLDTEKYVVGTFPTTSVKK